MANTLPSPTACCTNCDDQITVAVAGPAGAAGAAGAAGTDGVDAYAAFEAFVMPAEGATVDVTFDDAAWVSVNQVLYLETAGYMKATVIVGDVVTLENLEDTATSAYTVNAAGGTNVPGGKASPAGLQGPAGASGAAGVAATIHAVVTATDGLANETVLPAGNGLLHYNSAGPAFTVGDADLTTDVTGVLPVANGGTNAATKTPAFDNLAPTTTQGDTIYFDGADNIRLAIGTANQVMITNGTIPSWGQVSLTAGVTGILPAANGGAVFAYTNHATTGSYTLTVAQRFIFCGDEAGSAANNITLTLPAATTGHWYLLMVANGSTMVVNRAGSDTLYVPGSGGSGGSPFSTYACHTLTTAGNVGWLAWANGVSKWIMMPIYGA